MLYLQVQRDVLEDELKREQEEAERLQRRLQDLKAVPRVSSAVGTDMWLCFIGQGWRLQRHLEELKAVPWVCWAVG